MLRPDARFRARQGLVVSTKGDARYMTDLGTGEVWELNETAALLFESAGRGLPLGEVAALLAARFPEVPREEVQRDAEELLDELVRMGLLEPA